ncbi:hypothetical protein [Devosia epidermidihirudinis]|uniref:hypothetical protein n=1 Tax=Devosia epidermidihirudinis TaxID=1293439 RepID=UPI000B24068A|nr:hypothetical protein [Devosia epidermidihirudinis]
MAHLDTHDTQDILVAARREARRSGHVQNAQIMLVAAGLAAFGIVAVAGAMLVAVF